MALPGGVKQMIITFGAISLLKKVDQTDARVVAICRVIFVIYMAISLSVQLYIRSRILAKKEGGTVTVPPKPASPFAALSEPAPDADADADASAAGAAAKEGDASAEEEVDATVDATTAGGRRKPRGAAAAAAAEPQVMTTEEYDLSVLATVRRGLLFNALLLSVFHLKMGSLNPLVITSATGLARLLDEPLFQLHVLGRPAVDALARPFKPEANPLLAMLTGTPPDAGADADADADAPAGAAGTSAAVAAAPVTAAGEGGGAKGAATSTTTARRRKAAGGAGATRRVPSAAGRKGE